MHPLMAGVLWPPKIFPASLYFTLYAAFRQDCLVLPEGSYFLRKKKKLLLH